MTRMTEPPGAGFDWGPEHRRLPLSRSAVVNVMGVLVFVLLAATVIGLIELWPTGRTHVRSLGSTRTSGARVLAVRDVACVPAGSGCRRVTAKVLDGPRKGTVASFTIQGQVGSLALHGGDRIRVYRSALPPGAQRAPGQKADAYSFSDFDRRLPMLWLAAGFVVFLLATGRLHGLRALLGLIASLAIVVEFVIPAILHGHSPLEVAVSAGSR